MLNKDAGIPIQGMPLGRGNATSPYAVETTDTLVEFIDSGDVTCTYPGGATTLTTVLAGSRYSISNDVTTITFTGVFAIG